MNKLNISVLWNACLASDFAALHAINWHKFIGGNSVSEYGYDCNNQYVDIIKDIELTSLEVDQLRKFMSDTKSFVYLGCTALGSSYNPGIYVNFRKGFKAAAKEVLDLNVITTLSAWNAIDWRKHKRTDHTLSRGNDYFAANSNIAHINSDNVARLYELSHSEGSLVILSCMSFSSGIQLEPTEAFYDFLDQKDRDEASGIKINDSGRFKSRYLVLGTDWDCDGWSGNNSYDSYEKAAAAIPSILSDRITEDCLDDDSADSLEFAIVQLLSISSPKAVEKTDRPLQTVMPSEFKAVLDKLAAAKQSEIVCVQQAPIEAVDLDFFETVSKYAEVAEEMYPPMPYYGSISNDNSQIAVAA